MKGLVGTTLEEVVIHFMRDRHPKSGVAIWERMVVGLQRVRRALPMLDRKLILKTLLAHTIEALNEAERTHPQVTQIIGITEGDEWERWAPVASGRYGTSSTVPSPETKGQGQPMNEAAHEWRARE